MQEQITTLAKLGAGLALAGACACGSIESRPPPPSPIQLHVEARGGTSAIRSIRAIKLTLELVEPQFALQADYLANRSNCMRIDVFNDGKYLQSEGVSPDGGWAIAAGDTSFTPQPGGGTETLLH